MGCAFGLVAENDSATPIRDLWDHMAAFEDTPSMKALDYPPHFTFAIYDNVDAEEVEAALGPVLSGREAVRIRFDRIRYFDIAPLVL